MAFLEGFTVVSVEQAVAAPFATRQLADLGARVIKIERSGGDFARRYDASVHGQSSYFVWLNRGKESVEVDLKTATGADLVASLLDRADVFVENLAPGAAEALGLGTAALVRRFPKLIHCSVSGYGRGGPFTEHKAYDLLIQCEVGLVSATGMPAEPSHVGISIVDIAGGMYAFTGILAALLERERTGRARSVSASLFDALAEWMSQLAYLSTYGGATPARSAARHPTIAPCGPFACRDGSSVFVAVQNEREWFRFCELTTEQREIAFDVRFATNNARVANCAALEAIIDSVFRAWDANSMTERLLDAQIVCARMNAVKDLLTHPQVASRDRLQDVGIPGGTMQALRPPVLFEDFRAPLGRVPDVGEHTAAVIAELGLSPLDR